MTRCEITELLVEQCDHCRQKAAPPARKKYTVKPGRAALQPLVARFAGRCVNCNASFEDGETIAPLYEGPDRVGWLGTCCQELWA